MEPGHVELLGFNPQPVSMPLAHQRAAGPGRVEQPAQARQVHAQGRVDRHRRRFSPQLFDQPIA
jgi:hypothetical protein